MKKNTSLVIICGFGEISLLFKNITNATQIGGNIFFIGIFFPELQTSLMVFKCLIIVTQIGIELLAPSAAPCGVRLIQKVGNSSEYLRGLLLPEISVVNQAATLITPRLPFQSGSRISLLHDGREDQGPLLKKVSATGSISQFELKLQNPAALASPNGAPPSTPGATEDEFDSLWPSL